MRAFGKTPTASPTRSARLSASLIVVARVTGVHHRAQHLIHAVNGLIRQHRAQRLGERKLWGRHQVGGGGPAARVRRGGDVLRRHVTDVGERHRPVHVLESGHRIEGGDQVPGPVWRVSDKVVFADDDDGVVLALHRPRHGVVDRRGDVRPFGEHHAKQPAIARIGDHDESDVLRGRCIRVVGQAGLFGVDDWRALGQPDHGDRSAAVLQLLVQLALSVGHRLADSGAAQAGQNPAARG